MAEPVDMTAAQADEGTRLDVALAARPEIGSRSAAARLIDARQVTVDGEPRPKRHRLKAGERVVVEVAHTDPSAEDLEAGAGVPYAIAYEDEHLIVVDKPAGVVVHPAPGHPTGTLAQALGRRAAGGAEAWRPGIVHRLDRDTSGLLVVAKSERVHRTLQEAIRERSVHREYIALIDGHPASRSGTIDAAIGRDRARRTIVSTRTDRPRGARTHFRELEALPRSTLVEARLETGRTHQVRAHFAAIGHPVVGDAAYGGEARDRLGLARQFLHSARLAFSHPATGAAVERRSPLPADLSAALTAARAEAPSA